MADFKELFTSEDFLAYQDRVTDCAVDWLHDAIFKRHRTPNEMQAAVDMFRSIIEIPANTFDQGDIGKRLMARVKARMIEIPAAVLRREMFNEP